MFLDASRLIHQKFNDLIEAAKIDLTFGEYHLLLKLAGNRPVSHAELLKQTGLNKGALSALLDRLTTEGHILQSGSQFDRRIKIVQLTGLGEALLEHASASLDRGDFDNATTFGMKGPLTKIRDALFGIAR
jgi:DNA-binding MarR family transcriptional regulator